MGKIYSGIDVGYGLTKTIKSTGDVMTYKSIVGMGVPDMMGMKSSAQIRSVVLDHQAYTVGEEAERFELPLIHARKQNSIESIAYKALVLASFNGDRYHDLKIVTGLPVDFHRTDKDKLSGIFKELLPHAEVKVIPQPVGTLYDLICDSNGDVTHPEFADARIGIIDIGTLTTDLVLIDKMDLVQKSSSTIQVGIDAFITRVRDHCAHIRRNLRQEEIESAVQTGYVKKNNQKIDIAGIIADEKTGTAKNIWSYVVNNWGAREDIDYYVVTGGGAILFKESFIIPGIVQTANPVMSNAFGYYKMARQLW